MKSAALLETELASRHLKALCHHFGRKVETDCDDASGWVQFPFGRCDLSANETHLTLQASADEQEQLDQVLQIMTSHLERFAFRENPELIWKEMKADAADGRPAMEKD